MPSIGNHLLRLLTVKQRTRLIAAGEVIQLELSETLCEPGALMRYVYFPTQGFISLIAKVEGSAGVEVGMIGHEGMLGAHLWLGVSTAPLHALVQGAGAALRLDSAAFMAEMASSATLQGLMKRYLYVLMVQLANSAACQRFHMIDARLARWLLMSEDRAKASTFHVTQEFLAHMLGVRRVGVTHAASALQHAGLIQYHRGKVLVTDRSGLEREACGCYESDRQVYATYLGSRSATMRRKT